MSLNEKHFHGSDMEEISRVYNIPENSIINFASNVNPHGCSNKLKEHLINSIDVIERYPDRDYSALRQSIAEYCNASSENIVVGNGCSELIESFIKAISPDHTTIVSPTYSEYAHAVNISGGETTFFELNSDEDFKLNISELKKTFTD